MTLRRTWPRTKWLQAEKYFGWCFFCSGRRCGAIGRQRLRLRWRFGMWPLGVFRVTWSDMATVSKRAWRHEGDFLFPQPASLRGEGQSAPRPISTGDELKRVAIYIGGEPFANPHSTQMSSKGPFNNKASAILERRLWALLCAGCVGSSSLVLISPLVLDCIRSTLYYCCIVATEGTTSLGYTFY